MDLITRLLRHVFLPVSWRTKMWPVYLVGDFDEEDKNDEDEEVVNDTDSSNDDVDDLESKVMTLRAKSRMLARYSVRSSDTDDDVIVTLFPTSVGNKDVVLSIAAECCASRWQQQTIDYTDTAEGWLLMDNPQVRCVCAQYAVRVF